MKKRFYFNGIFKIMLFCLLLSNFNAFAQKTNIWIVRAAEPSELVLAANSNVVGLSADGQDRAEALLRTLKHEKIQTIYIPAGKIGEQTARPLSAKAKILPRVYTDSISAFVKKLNRNFQGTNVLIIAQYKDLMPLVSELGVTPPFAEINEEDYDFLFSISIDENDKKEIFISNYGKKHHVTEIPQEYIIDKFYPGFVPPMNSH